MPHKTWVSATAQRQRGSFVDGELETHRKTRQRTPTRAHACALPRTHTHARAITHARAHTYAQKMPLRAQRAPTRAFCGLFTHNNPQQIAKSAYGRRAAHPLARCAERMRGAARQTRREVPLLLLVSPALPASRAVLSPSPPPPLSLPSPPPPLTRSLPRSICSRQHRSLRSSSPLHQPPALPAWTG